jgi:hypothetical protein
MSDQAHKAKYEAVPQWAEGLYFKRGHFSEAMVYHNDDAIYFELRGQDSGLVRFTFEMVDTLKNAEVEEREELAGSPK